MSVRRQLDGVRAIRRAAVLLALVLEVPLLTWIATRLTGEPRSESLEIDGVPVDLVCPRRGGPWPAWVFVTGAHPERRNEPIVQRLARALARAGYVCLVPDLPGLGEGQVTQRTLDAAVAVINAAAERSDVRAGRIALCGASTGASIALLAAARPELAGRISMVAAVTPYADLERIVGLATTRCYPAQAAAELHDVTALLRRSVGRSLCAALPAGPERERLLALLRDESDDIDPLEQFRELADGNLGTAARAVVNVLANQDPTRFRELYDVLPPDVRSLVRSLSPLANADCTRVPVELVVPPADIYFPMGEATSLARSLPSARLTVTGTLDHTRPALSLGGIPDLLRFQGFVLRGLAGAL